MDAAQAISCSTASEKVANIRGSRKKVLFNHTAHLVLGGLFHNVHNEKKAVRRYGILGTTDNDLIKHILTTCTESSLPAVVTLLEEYHVNKRIDVHNMDICHLSVLAFEYVNVVGTTTSSDIVENKGSNNGDVTIQNGIVRFAQRALKKGSLYSLKRAGKDNLLPSAPLSPNAPAGCRKVWFAQLHNLCSFRFKKWSREDGLGFDKESGHEFAFLLH